MLLLHGFMSVIISINRQFSRNLLLPLLLVLTSLAPFSSNADNGTGKVQLLRIKNMMKGGDYMGAWHIIRGLEKSDTSTAELYYLGGTCHFHLKNYPEAIERLTRSVRLNAQEDVKKHYFLARALQAEGELEKAVDAYQTYLSVEKSKGEKENASIYLQQCQNAIKLMANPLDVTIKNIGEAINTEFPEYNPTVSADGKTMIFTSRRPESTGKLLDPDDGNFFEDIYISRMDSITGKWLEAVPVEGQLNTPSHDANMGFSPDGTQIFVYRNMGYRGSGEIFVSKKAKNGKWSAAKPIEGDINTSYFESSACVSPDGKTLYFVSERPRGGFGMGDIYKAKRLSKTKWGEVENLGPVINNEYDQIGVFIHPDGNTMYFASDDPRISIGGYDIFVSRFENGKWSAPENIGYPINTPGDERFFNVSTDGATAWFSSNRSGGEGNLDIWEVDLRRTLKGGKDATEGLAIFRGQIIDADAAQIIEAELVATDVETGKKTTFSSDENGQFFVMLPGNKNYTVTIKHPGYRNFDYDLQLLKAEEGTFTIEKTIVLEKE